MTTTEVKDVVGTFFVKLRGLNIENNFLNTQLPLNENDNNSDRKLNDINYNRTVMKLHDSGWKKNYFCWCFFFFFPTCLRFLMACA